MQPLIVISLLFVSSALLDNVDACFGAGPGLCGGGLGGANPCFQPPPPVACPQPCAPGYQCGQYGCYRRRARARASLILPSSKLINGYRRAPGAFKDMIDSNGYQRASGAFKDMKDLMGSKSPDQQFAECCERRLLPDSCLQKCTFATYTKSALSAMFVKTDPCPIEAANVIQYCAGGGRDHRHCCIQNGVTTTLSGEKCLLFCDQRPGNVTQLDLSYAACYDRFDSIKSCFFHDLNQRSSSSMEEFRR